MASTNALKKVSSRILTFDLMRGYFLVAIILNHLQFFPSGLDVWSARGSLYVTAAEGFFLISGIVLGIVRGRKLIAKPFKLAAKLLLIRSLQLYVAAVLLMLIFTVIGWQFLGNPGLKPGIPWNEINPFELIWGALTFQYIYGWADYLRLYAIFIFFSPIALLLLRKGLWWVVLVISSLVWMVYPFSPLPTSELSQVFSWQLIFFAGFVIGFHWQDISAWWKAIRGSLRRVISRTIIGLALVSLAVNIFIAVGTDISSAIDIFDKHRLPPARLALFALWFSAAFLLFRRFEARIVKAVGWLLLPFGTNSLYVYILHAFFVFFVHLFFSPSPTNWVYNLLISTSVIAIIWLAIRYKVLMKIIPR